MTLPEWKEQARAPRDVQLHWDIYASYAVYHENEHIRISQKYARRLKSYMKNASAPNCALLTSRMLRDTQQILDAHSAEQLMYGRHRSTPLRALPPALLAKIVA